MNMIRDCEWGRVRDVGNLSSGFELAEVLLSFKFNLASNLHSHGDGSMMMISWIVIIAEFYHRRWRPPSYLERGLLHTLIAL